MSNSSVVLEMLREMEDYEASLDYMRTIAGKILWSENPDTQKKAAIELARFIQFRTRGETWAESYEQADTPDPSLNESDKPSEIDAAVARAVAKQGPGAAPKDPAAPSPARAGAKARARGKNQS